MQEIRGRAASRWFLGCVWAGGRMETPLLRQERPWAEWAGTDRELAMPIRHPRRVAIVTGYIQMLGGQGRGQTRKHLGNVSKGMAGRWLKRHTQSQNDEEMTEGGEKKTWSNGKLSSRNSTLRRIQTFRCVVFSRALGILSFGVSLNPILREDGI